MIHITQYLLTRIKTNGGRKTQLNSANTTKSEAADKNNTHQTHSRQK